MNDFYQYLENFGKAIGNRTRFQILELLVSDNLTVNEIALALDISQPTASQHLKLMHSALFITRQKQGKYVYYGLSRSYAINGLGQIAEALQPQTDSHKQRRSLHAR